MVIFRLNFWSAFGAAVVAPVISYAAIVGVASVIDGDTIVIHDQHIRLYGIDAPESRQRCKRSLGEEYACGREAAFALDDLVTHKTVRCEGKDKDRYQRFVAVCYIGKQDINAEMVKSGNAIAYRKYGTDYAADEVNARVAKRGLWSGTFEKPWDYRMRMRNSLPGAIPSNPACQIKGNIGASGRKLYHLPSGHTYAGTRINVKKGERWFCTEDAAKSAGWIKAPN